MKRLEAVTIVVLLLWALIPGAGEIAENLVHLAREGHLAHAAPDGDRHEPTSPEHGCTGTAHLCSCCISLSCLVTSTNSQIFDLGAGEFVEDRRTPQASRPSSGVYRPPRA